MANPEYHADFWVAAATIGPVVFLAVLVVAAESARAFGTQRSGTTTTAKKVVAFGVYAVSLVAALLTAIVTTDATYALARESDRGLSLSATRSEIKASLILTIVVVVGAPLGFGVAEVVDQLRGRRRARKAANERAKLLAGAAEAAKPTATESGPPSDDDSPKPYGPS